MARVTDPLGLTGIFFMGMFFAGTSCLAFPVASTLNDFGGGVDGGLGLSVGLDFPAGGGWIPGPKTWAGLFGLINCGPEAIGLIGPGTSALGPVDADADGSDHGSAATIESILASTAADSLS